MLSVLLYVVAVVLIGVQAFLVGGKIGSVWPGWLGLALAVFTFGVLPHL